MASFDGNAEDSTDTYAAADDSHMVADRTGQVGLILAVIASVLALVSLVAGPHISTLIHAWNLDTRSALNIYGFIDVYVVGLSGLAAVILAGISLSRPQRHRGQAAAALALGSFHAASMIAIPLTTLIGASS